MKVNKIKRRIKGIGKLLLGSSIMIMVILGIMWLLGTIMNWLCEDMGRYILGMIILIYIVYRQIKEELDK